MLAVQLTTLFADDELLHEWHSHVGSDGGRAKLTLVLYDPEGADRRSVFAGLVQGGSVDFRHVRYRPET